MSLQAISVNQLSKRYVLRHQAKGDVTHTYATFREEMGRWVKGWGKPKAPGRQDEFWALKDVSFDVEQGGVVGIIGRNGAGKSTLLKILSRTVEPTSGNVRLRGRVASLLEVGTGFHPELTGRENIYLNGAVLGMTRAEVKSRFDEIVDFADVERFLDTPVKRYSSGMYVRLAFAVAAHLEPEILIVDEVLAVGDASFQKKCLGRVARAATQGRTVLLVTHNLGYVTDICRRAVLLESGSIAQIGEAAEVVRQYLRNGAEVAEAELTNVPGTGDDSAGLTRLRLLGDDLMPKHFFQCGDPVTIEVTFEVRREGVLPQPNLHFITERGEQAFVSVENTGVQPRLGLNTVRLTIPPDFFNGMSYAVTVYLATHAPLKVHGRATEALNFTVIDTPTAAARAGCPGTIPGCVRPLLQWQPVPVLS